MAIENVVYLDNHLLVLAKPAGMLAQADETGDEDLLSLGKAFIKQRFNKPGEAFLGLVHRLDRPASGLMVFARTSKAAKRLTNQFRNHTVGKRYLALVEGHPPENDCWEDYLLKKDRVSQVVSEHHPKGKLARLRYRRLAGGGTSSLVTIALETGRAHQIRLQFASRGFPLIGDFRYGASQAFDGRNLALHAYHLDLKHPIGAKSMTWTLVPPSTWEGHFTQAIQALNLAEPPWEGSW